MLAPSHESPKVSMNGAALAHREIERLQKVFSLNTLDTPSNPVVDDVAALAATMCQTPIAAVSYIDSSRQRINASVGLTAREAKQTPKLCAHAILQSQPLIVADMREDERFLDNPLVNGPPHIRSYAGVPIRLLDGYPLGVLWVADPIPRRWRGKHVSMLEHLSRQALTQLELPLYIRKHDRLLEELRVAGRDREMFTADLHDGAMQTLYAVGLQLDAARSQISRVTDEVTTHLTNAITQLNQAMRQMRTLIAGHAEDSSTAESFTVFLESLITLLRQVSPTVFQITAEPSAVVCLSGGQRAHLQNIVRSGLLNVVRHAQAQTCVIQLTQGPARIRLRIRDDGRGFNVSSGGASWGTGLQSIASRATHMKARFHLSSQPGTGTTLDLEIPLG